MIKGMEDMKKRRLLVKANDTPFLVGHSGMEMDDNMAKEKGKSITDRWESEKFKPTGRKLNKEQLEEMVKNKKYPKRKK